MPIWLKEKLKHYNVLKSQDVRPNRKSNEPSMNLRVKDSVLRKSLVRKYLSNKSKLLLKQRLSANAESLRDKLTLFSLATMLKRKVLELFSKQRLLVINH